MNSILVVVRKITGAVLTLAAQLLLGVLLYSIEVYRRSSLTRPSAGPEMSDSATLGDYGFITKQPRDFPK
jgi:hypothetical protein